MKILTPNSNKHAVHVYSEIGNLKEVIVQKPGDELRNFDVGDRQSFLMDGDIDVVQARKEHDRFVNILKKNGVKVYYFNDLFCETWDLISDDDKIRFINKFVNETKQPSKELCEKIKNYLIVNFLKNAKGITKVLIEGIQSKDLYETTSNRVYITKPLANIYFQRDNYSCFGDCVSINKMKYLIRQRESLLSELVWKFHPKFSQTQQVYSRNESLSIEGGDIFPYTKDTLVIGISQRTSLRAALLLAKNLKSAKTEFKQIVCINVPKAARLMHLDTWLTMLDTNKFLYSPVAVKSFKFWKISLKSKTITAKILNKVSLSEVLEEIIGCKPILIPVAGNNSQLDINRETKYDGTNFLVIRPGVVVGFDRNRETIKALKAAGITVLGFEGDELSLGEGNARCMSMPIWREDI